MTLETVRTPDDRFGSLPDWPYESRYLEDLDGYDGLPMHYIDEGPRDAPVFLCLHGEPTWAYLYRKMIPIFLEAGARVVAPDFFGFGRSDKPVADDAYTCGFHREALLGLIERLDLTDDEASAYGAPFPGPEYQAGVRTLPALVPTSPEMDGVAVSRKAVEWWSTQFDGHPFMAIDEADPVLASVMPLVHGVIRGCPEPMRLPDAGHFVQEWGAQIARAALAAWESE